MTAQTVYICKYVGSLSACYFGKRGHEVHIYEYRNDPRNEECSSGRSINLALSKRGRSALAAVGLEDLILSSAIPMRGRMIHPIQGKKRSIPYDPVNNQCIYSVGRKYLNEMLIKEAEFYKNVHLHFNHKITAVNLQEGKIWIHRLDIGDGNIFEDKGDLLVGADGAFSVIRRQMLKEPLFSYSQTYIEHGYIELSIPPENNHLMESNHLHIWPRGQFMMIALPNADSSWTVTLFMPFKNFSELKDQNSIISFFKENFPDALKFIGKELLEKQFSKGPSSLISVKCSKYHVGEKSVIIGDAAHAIVPFYGQGMNAGFEDCRLLDELIHNKDLQLGEALNLFSASRRKDAEAICDLAMYNYVEMRDLVNHRSYLARKKLDDLLYQILPKYWIPLYQSVTFTNLPYHHCLENKAWQDSVLWHLTASCVVILFSCLVYALINHL